MPEKVTEWLTGAFKHPLSLLFFVLGVVLILLGVSDGLNLPVLNQIVAAQPSRGIALLLGVVFCAISVWLYYHPPKDAGSSDEYDVFLSAPMAAYTDDDEYKRARLEVKKVFDAFQTSGFKVFWAAEKVESIDDFDPKDLSIEKDLDAISESKYFCLIYPQRQLTSAIFEAGYALALEKFSLYFVKEVADLPFLMRDTTEVYSYVRIHDSSEWTTIDDIAKMIHKHKEQMFVQPK